MDYNRLIHDFVDGTLDTSQEENLFMALASSEDLRMEYKHLLTIKDAVRSDVVAFTPAADSTIKIFSTLGFASPVQTAAGVGFFSRATSFVSKYSQAILGSIISAVVTCIILLSVLNNGEININSSKAGRNEFASKKVESSLPRVESSEITSQKESLNEKVKVITRVVYRDRTQLAQYDESMEQEDNKVIDSSVGSIDETRLMHSFLNKADILGIQGGIDFPVERLSLVPAENRALPLSILNTNNGVGIIAELSGAQNWPLLDANIHPSEYSRFNNTNLMVLMPISEDLYIGAEIRQETFHQVFEGDSGFLRYRYEQQPNFTTYGLGLRYNYLTFGGINTFAQLTLGGNTSGWVGRFMTGLTYQPYQDFSFLLGLEYSGFRYTHQGNSYYSSKVGLKYGIGIHF